MIRRFHFPTIILLLTAFIATAKDVQLSNTNIHVTGAPYIFRSPERLFYRRFSDQLLSLPDSVKMFAANIANSTSGIIISFKVKSTKIHMRFQAEPGLAEKGSFLITRNGSFYRTISFTGVEAKKTFEFTLDSLSANEAAVYEIVLPSYANFSVTGLGIDDNSDLLPFNTKKKVYIGFGDSITHGRGQEGATYLTYPYQIAQKLNMEFFNQAIGGAKVSVAQAERAGELPTADVITVLIGYNDLNAGNRTEAQFESAYRQYLSLICKKQPNAKIFCINLLYTKKKENEKTHLTPDNYRAIIRNVVGDFQRTNKKLFLIEGENITSSANLQPGETTDPVHMTVKGAGMFANALYKEMQQRLN